MTNKTRIQRLVDTDKIRIYKIIELFQYSSIFIILAIICSKAMNYLFSDNINKIKQKSKIIIHIEIFIIAFLFCLTSFYVIKLAKVIPSLMAIYDKDFIPYTTLEYSVHIVFIVVFIKLNNSLSSRLKFLNYIN